MSGIREWEQATQTRVIGCCLTCLPCRNDLRIRRGIANLLNPHGMTGSEIVDAPCVSMSLERPLSGGHRLGEVRFLSQSLTNTNKNITMEYLVELLNIAVLTALCMYGYLILMVMI